MAFATTCTIGIVIASRVIDRWDEPFAFPTTAFLALALGLLSAFIMSRVRRTEQRLEEAVAEQLAARESIEQLGRVRDRLIANVSHELRTPLTSTLGFIETILRDDIQLSEDERTLLTRHARDGGMHCSHSSRTCSRSARRGPIRCCSTMTRRTSPR
ncbi:MAG: histidine kinase [Thermoleophilia bacterium]|nr:histidine kinase [Thermoleophilia bacterium]